mgnify:CR=1 FL=1
MAQERPSFVDLSAQLTTPSVQLPPEPDEALAALGAALETGQDGSEERYAALASHHLFHPLFVILMRPAQKFHALNQRLESLFQVHVVSSVQHGDNLLRACTYVKYIRTCTHSFFVPIWRHGYHRIRPTRREGARG